MTLELLALSIAAATSTATTTADEPALDRFRMPWEALIDKTVGTASKPVQFDWRRSNVHIGALAAQPAEFNNYNAFRTGLVVRLPTDTLMWEIGASYVFVFDTDSSRKLALTPYRQPGRPDRFEIDVSMGVPLAEGVVTAWPSFFPAVELVFSAYVNLRYRLYTGSWSGLRFGEVVEAIISPEITDEEIENLEDDRLPGMEVDRTRYGLYAGLGTDIYFDFGMFVSPRILLSVPLFAALADSKMLYGIDFTLSIGAAF